LIINDFKSNESRAVYSGLVGGKAVQ
jgi:hypothetical protein